MRVKKMEEQPPNQSLLKKRLHKNNHAIKNNVISPALGIPEVRPKAPLLPPLLPLVPLLFEEPETPVESSVKPGRGKGPKASKVRIKSTSCIQGERSVSQQTDEGH
jgi:hypothetical protein